MSIILFLAMSFECRSGARLDPFIKLAAITITSSDAKEQISMVISPDSPQFLKVFLRDNKIRLGGTIKNEKPKLHFCLRMNTEACLTKYIMMK